jgi:hypothetical protein
LKHSTVLALGFAALAAAWGSAPVTAGISDNALNPNALNPNALAPNALSNNALTPNALTPNALTPNGVMTSFVTLQAVRLALPDGSEVNFRRGG